MPSSGDGHSRGDAQPVRTPTLAVVGPGEAVASRRGRYKTRHPPSLARRCCTRRHQDPTELMPSEVSRASSCAPGGRADNRAAVTFSAPTRTDSSRLPVRVRRRLPIDRPARQMQAFGSLMPSSPIAVYRRNGSRWVAVRPHRVRCKQLRSARALLRRNPDRVRNPNLSRRRGCRGHVRPNCECRLRVAAPTSKP